MTYAIISLTYAIYQSSENHEESSNQRSFDIDVDSEDSPKSSSEDIVETDQSNESILDDDSQQTPVSRQVIKERRELLSAQLKGHKSERLKRKLPLESQLLSISRKELQIKKTNASEDGHYGQSLLQLYGKAYIKHGEAYRIYFRQICFTTTHDVPTTQ